MIEDTTKRDPLGMLIGAMDIESMEAAGGRQFAADVELMPKDGPWDELVELGFAPPEPTDDALFVRTRLPKGWSKQMLDDPRGGVILDERGVARVGTFYKAAFYDRKADCHLIAPGYRLATYAIYSQPGDPDYKEPGKPELWDVLTEGERAEYVDALDDYLARAEEHPSIYGDRVERVQELKAALS